VVKEGGQDTQLIYVKTLGPFLDQVLPGSCNFLALALIT
jgi:hypothetical protein